MLTFRYAKETNYYHEACQETTGEITVFEDGKQIDIINFETAKEELKSSPLKDLQLKIITGD